MGRLSFQYSSKVEKEVLEFWSKNRIYEKVKQAGKGRPKFYFLDGPPYVTSLPHVGTAWNKILKDCIIRFKRMQGYDVHDKPGYDCHGLPIEVKAEEQLGISTKKELEEKVTVKKFIEECKRLVERNIKLQTETFKRLGVWMNWEQPYLTLTNEYIESAWWTIKRASERGLLARGLKVVHWCPRCETALAGYEVTDEYRMKKDPSIYVKFPILGRKNEFILIWTTTPWTLPANMAVMVHPDFDYVRVKANGEIYILAKDRCDPVFSEIGLDYEVIDEFKGSELNGLRYEHPLTEEVPKRNEYSEVCRVVLSKEYVSLEEGTGCVHSAPSHGEEDFEVGVKYNLPVFSPVESSGIFGKDGGKYCGKSVWKANSLIIEDLKKKGLLLHAGSIHHKYPHCWRCKEPLILRATEQWFLRITGLKEKMLEENEKVIWVPEWAGSRRFKDWLLGIKDWVISRQRYWGTPMPIWVCEECGSYEVIGSLRELREKSTSPIEELEIHKPWIDEVFLKCSCGGRMRRVPDVLDVWLDSGIASWASIGFPSSCEEFDRLWPADLIIEAHDQTRGWFYSQLGAGVIAFDSCPYKAVIMHGHGLDEKGVKMSKSLGNFVPPERIADKYGADALRLYELKHTTWEDLRFKEEEVETASRALNVIWNVYRFASSYMSLDKFDPKRWTLERVSNNLCPEDRWILSRIHSLIKKVTDYMNRYLIHEVVKLLYDFILEEVSRWYVKLIRRRVWIEAQDPGKLAAYATLYEVLKKYLILVAPFIPFSAEALYQRAIKPLELGLPESIHMFRWPEPNEELIDEDLEAKMEISREIVLAATRIRQRAKLKQRWPIRTVIVSPSKDEVTDSLRTFMNVVKSQINCRELKIERIEQELPNFLSEEGPYGKIFVEVTMLPELMEEAIAKEIVRRVQIMRKDLDLKFDEYIDLTIVTSEEDVINAALKKRDYIVSEVRAKAFSIGKPKEVKILEKVYAKDWSIEGKKLKVAISPPSQH